MAIGIPSKVQLTAKNLRLTVGSNGEMWNKIMKEVKEKRYAGPYPDIPFTEDFIQSPIGLVPKDGGRKTRLIFHLSHPKGKNQSVNDRTSPVLKSVNYQNFDDAIMLCLQKMKLTDTNIVYLGKSDFTSAFRHLCIAKRFWRYLIMKAQSPFDGKFYFFVDKCLPFGAAVSCALFQAFSDCIAHIVQFKSGKVNINYLDDFLFIQAVRAGCNGQLRIFLHVCQKIHFPVSNEKTEWATTCLSFLGLLIDAKRGMILIPQEKIHRALTMIHFCLEKKNKKITLRQLQQLCGFLNFLTKAILPGRAFTRRMYAFGQNIKKQHHHLQIKSELRADLLAWKCFLEEPGHAARPFFYFDVVDSDELFFYTDASRNSQLGCGGVCNNDYFIMQWDEETINCFNPSINYLELYAVMVGVLNWLHRFANRKVVIFL